MNKSTLKDGSKVHEYQRFGVKTHLKAGYECPPGWWKYKEGKKHMCCHWVYDPYWRNYKVECTE